MSNFYIINLQNQAETHFENNEIIIGRQLLENVNIFMKTICLQEHNQTSFILVQ